MLGELHEKLSEMFLIFVVMEIPDKQIPDHMNEFLKKTGRKHIPGTRKLCGVMKAKKDLALYTCSQVVFGSRIESDGLLSVL